MKKLTALPEWQALLSHHQGISKIHIRDLLTEDDNRSSQYSIHTAGIFLNYARNFTNNQTWELLRNLATARELSLKIKQLFDEQRHTALRNAQNISDSIRATQEKLTDFVNKIHLGMLKGVAGKTFTHVVNIGIGGSHQGPLLCTEALKEFAQNSIKFHFLSTVDKHQLEDIWHDINPESTLFIISSKSFSTIETLTNAATLIERMKAQLGENAITHHFAAVTADVKKATAFGINPEFIFPIWNWVGGRYSIWSAIGLPLMLMIGAENFQLFLSGAHEMDIHFQETSWENNMPFILGMLSVWYINFFGTSAQAIIPYSYRLRYLIPYLQQVHMESNGKGIDLDGNPVDYATCPIIFGEEGCNGQHTYHQLLHQGKHTVPVDFILVGNKHAFTDQHHAILFGSGLSQAHALMQGKSIKEALKSLSQIQDEKEAHYIANHQAIPGNRPSNLIYLEAITPKTLGALIALYEHKIFVESVIWGINPFDQWGVELGKQLLPSIVDQLKQSTSSNITDPITAVLLSHIRK